MLQQVSMILTNSTIWFGQRQEESRLSLASTMQTRLEDTAERCERRWHQTCGEIR